MNKNKSILIEIENRLREQLKPVAIEVNDDSQKHVGHAGAKSGGGHFSVKIISQAFQGKTLAERHRMIYTILNDMMLKDIHALQIDAKPIHFDELIQLVSQILNDLKVKDISVINIQNLSKVMDALVICTATSSRHAASSAEKLVTALKKVGIQPFNSIEDQKETGWILIDFLDVVVHIMLAETREYYNLEKLWTMSETKPIQGL
jgi:ribosome silencing factor RsfS/YbeB/iojap